VIVSACCTYHTTSQHIRDRTNILTNQLSLVILAATSAFAPSEKPLSFHLVHPLIRAIGSRILHYAKGLGTFFNCHRI
jgi:hypothetical protein